MSNVIITASTFMSRLRFGLTSVGVRGFATRRKPWAAAHIILAFAIAGCASADGDDRPLGVRFERLYAFGGVGDTTLPLRSLFPQGIAVDSRDVLYVLNADEGSVARFRGAERLRPDLGRLGSGPGEFAMATSISATSDGRVFVRDARKQAFVGFDATGAPLAEVSMRGWGRPTKVAMRSDGAVVMSSIRGDASVLRVLSSGRTDTLAIAPLLPARLLDASRCGLSGHEDRPVFTQDIRWTLVGDSVAMIARDSFAIHMLDGVGRVAATMSRSREPIVATAEGAERAMADGWRITVDGHECALSAQEAVRQLGYAPTVPAYESVVFDPSARRLWATRWAEKGEARVADVYERDAGYLGTVPLGRVRPVVFLSTGRVVSIEMDESEVPVIVVYGVRY